MRTLGRSIVAVVVLTLVFGLAYPLLFTGFAQIAFADRADGSLVERDGTVVGSKLAAQAFTKPEYFHPRPSATAPEYNAAATTFANLGPTNPDLATAVKERAAAILALEGPYNPGFEIGDIPVDGKGARALRGAGRRTDRRVDRRPLARDLRRGRRERARAESCS